jgi:cysteine desulfurase
MEIYLDNAATTKPCIESVNAITDCLTENYGNPSSLHSKGLSAQLAVDKSRKQIASALGCDQSEIVFTSCATESTNTALKSVALKYGKRKKTIITSSVEHSSVKETLKYLSENGYNIVYIHPRDDGKFYPADFINAITDDTFLITVMLVNNENGYILPAKKIFESAKRKDKNIICHCDAVQAFMKIPFKVKTLSCDLLSLSAHKIYSAKGSGALYIKKGIIIHPLLLGGGQEKKLRSGTESVPLICGFGAACEFLQNSITANLNHYTELKKYLLEKLSLLDDIVVNSIDNDEIFAPYIVNFSVLNIRSEIMLHYLEKKNIFVSSGSACSKGKSSGVLEEFKINSNCADSALRISFSYENTKNDIDMLVDAISNAQKEISKVK